jgi:hypothetical protein
MREKIYVRVNYRIMKIDEFENLYAYMVIQDIYRS